MEYLIQWKDGHEPSWLLSDYISKNVLAEYESPLLTATKKADASALQSNLESDGGDARDVDAVDLAGRMALHFVSGLSSNQCVKLLAEAGAEVDHGDRGCGLVGKRVLDGGEEV
ncbi:unnamed protein product [Linum trigynum]|uniref:Uncharacterized protein n=1 Tax=Linum trigynum TaxID=586398 RepID=A0AAV2FHB1_9ROSI